MHRLIIFFDISFKINKFSLKRSFDWKENMKYLKTDDDQILDANRGKPVS